MWQRAKIKKANSPEHVSSGGVERYGQDKILNKYIWVHPPVIDNYPMCHGDLVILTNILFPDEQHGLRVIQIEALELLAEFKKEVAFIPWLEFVQC